MGLVSLGALLFTMGTSHLERSSDQGTPKATAAGRDQDGDQVVRIELMEIVVLALFLLLAVVLAHALLA